ncbi:MAG TPA: PqiC family protein [Longimicrobiales bacterium]|nr:PqiC family protein [Longimicrobiales bacterium]
MRRTTGKAGVLVAVVALAIGGCSLGRKTTPLEQYVLGEARSVENPAPVDLRSLVIGMRRLDLAPYLATPAIAVRRESRIVHSEYHRWGEDPREGINRAVARYLAALPVRAVDVAPWPAASRHDFLVQLHVSRFEGVATPAGAGEAHLLSSWEIYREQDGTVLARGTTDYREPGWQIGDYAGLVMLLDRGLRTLVNDLASCLGTLAADPPTSTAGGSPTEPRPTLACVATSTSPPS